MAAHCCAFPLLLLFRHLNSSIRDTHMKHDCVSGSRNNKKERAVVFYDLRKKTSIYTDFRAELLAFLGPDSNRAVNDIIDIRRSRPVFRFPLPRRGTALASSRQQVPASFRVHPELWPRGRNKCTHARVQPQGVARLHTETRHA